MKNNIVNKILNITNNSDYRYLSVNSTDGKRIFDEINNNCFDIDFIMYLTGHDKETIIQMHQDYIRFK